MKQIKNAGPFRCICCEKELKTLLEDYDGLVDQGLVSHVCASYGSLKDGDVYQIALCDSCIAKKEKDDIIILKGNYLFGKSYNHRGELVEIVYEEEIKC